MIIITILIVCMDNSFIMGDDYYGTKEGQKMASKGSKVRKIWKLK